MRYNTEQEFEDIKKMKSSIIKAQQAQRVKEKNKTFVKVAGAIGNLHKLV